MCNILTSVSLTAPASNAFASSATFSSARHTTVIAPSTTPTKSVDFNIFSGLSELPTCRGGFRSPGVSMMPTRSDRCFYTSFLFYFR